MGKALISISHSTFAPLRFFGTTPAAFFAILKRTKTLKPSYTIRKTIMNRETFECERELGKSAEEAD